MTRDKRSPVLIHCVFCWHRMKQGRNRLRLTFMCHRRCLKRSKYELKNWLRNASGLVREALS